MIFSMSDDYLLTHHASATAKEIHQQPTTWLKTQQQFESNKEQYVNLVEKYRNDPTATIIFAGAGSSEFVGNALVWSIQTKSKATIQSIATTDLLSDVSLCLKKDSPTLMVSFGRSGSSPESVGAFLEVQHYCNRVEHIFITCNTKGKLAGLTKEYDNILSIELTPETHDQSFAMTSSFSNMYLMAALCFDQEITFEHITSLAKIASNFVDHEAQKVKEIIDTVDFSRIVYLGSNTLKGIAQESALKILELSAGKTPSLFDTFLGFRHGPKSFLNNETLSVMYLSNQEDVRRYEVDLLHEMSSEENKGNILVVDTKDDAKVQKMAHHMVSFKGLESVPMSVVALAYLLVGQTISLFTSLKLDITPDNPDPSGSVNRVVKGVTLYVEGAK
jgi:tagatose-6-phosphate ketose/aldose isomerase